MNLHYKKATLQDIEILTETRAEVLKAANELPWDTDMSEIKRRSRDYYRTALADGTHTAYLVFDDDIFAAAGGISYYRVMPTWHNPRGSRAYIMNMYTSSNYRRKRIAYHVLELLVQDAKERGITSVSLEATKTGRFLYERFGFVPMSHEMELPEDFAGFLGSEQTQGVILPPS